jgi:uncharacterized membrane protein (DUF4010 family)
LAYGVVAACTVLLVRVVVATSVLNASLAWKVLSYLVAPFVVGALILVTGLRHSADEPRDPGSPGNPLQIGAALQMAAIFQVALFAVDLIRRVWGDAGVIPSAALIGFTDMDALTISMARQAGSGLSIDIAAQALAVGILANTVLKLILALVAGAPGYRRVVGMSLTAIGLAIGVSFIWR